MKNMTRRGFINTAALAASGGIAFNAVQSNAQGKMDSIDALSGLKTGVMKPMTYKELPGFLSAEQIAPHYKNHYGGALKGHLDSDKQLDAITRGDQAMNSDAYATIQRGRTTKGNSALLHEVYFDGMTSHGSTPDTDLRRAIESRFGTIDKWQADFAAAANSANGWAVLALNRISGKLYNVVSDEHAVGLFWQAVPIIALDMYEHSYYVDYLNNKGAYIDKYFDYINWQSAEKRFNEAV
jgi:superoxide dismutase, Fe-Mn family